MERHWYTAGWTLLGAVFGVLAVTLTWLFLLGSIACFAVGYAVSREWISRRRLIELLPFEVKRKERTRRPKPFAAPPGILDMEVAFNREGKKFRKSLERVGNEVTAVGALMERYGPRFQAAKDEAAEHKVRLSREFAGKVGPHAKRMEDEERSLRSSTQAFSASYLSRLKAFEDDVDLGQIRPSIATLLDTTVQSRASIKGYRDALARTRMINLQREINRVLDQLRESADKILEDVDAAIEMEQEALREIDGRKSTTGVSRAERRRRAKGSPTTSGRRPA